MVSVGGTIPSLFIGLKIRAGRMRSFGTVSATLSLGNLSLS